MGPLSDIKILEFQGIGPGPFCTMMLSDMGAQIVRIDRATGRVTASIDASGLLTRMEALRADVLNGIAYRPETETFLLTGKLWPHVFEVELVPR